MKFFVKIGNMVFCDLQLFLKLGALFDPLDAFEILGSIFVGGHRILRFLELPAKLLEHLFETLHLGGGITGVDVRRGTRWNDGDAGSLA